MAVSESERVAAEERKQLRPYRRLVGVVFALAIAAASIMVLRGIIRHLDRLPSVDRLDKPKLVDVRALRACAEDLERLEARIRVGAGRAFASLPSEVSPDADWEALARQFEIDRLGVVARCRLNEPSKDAAVGDLESAASEIEGVIRSYALLYARHKESGVSHALEARRSLMRAQEALRTR